MICLLVLAGAGVSVLVMVLLIAGGGMSMFTLGECLVMDLV